MTHDQSATWLNGLSRDQLFEGWGITRVSQITRLDIVGIPVYSAARPAAKTLSCNSGKSLQRRLARAGAIAEAIEYFTFENPVGGYRMGKLQSVEFDLLPLAKD